MKRYQAVLTLAAVVTAGSAMADYRPGYERPIEQAELVSNQRTYPRPVQLMTTKQDGSRRQVTGMVLTEDTGIRCITTPCPSERVTQFAVTSARVLPGNSVEYTAVGNLIVTGPLGRPRVVQRTVTLVDHTNSVLLIARPYQWEVTVRQGLAVVGRASGNPEPIYTTQGVGLAGDSEGVAGEEEVIAE